MKQVTIAIISNSEIMPGVHLLWLESSQIAHEARPGQFVMVRCGEETMLQRPLSIHQRDGNKIALLFTVVGKGTHWLAQRQVGDGIDLLGPLGSGFSIRPESKNILLVAGGIGMAPLHFLVDEAIEWGREVTMLLGARTATQLYPRRLLPFGVELVTATEDGTTGVKGMITDLLPDFIDEANQVFACGPLAMYQTMVAKKQPLKGKPAQISLEMRMGCGLGVCYACTVKTKNGLKQVCKDGPVFDLDDIIWETL